MIDYHDFIDRYLDAWNSHDIESIRKFYTDDVVYIDMAVGEVLHYESFGVWVAESFKKYPDLRFVKNSVTHGEDRFCYEWDMLGTHPKGTKIFIKGISHVILKGNKICHNTDYWCATDPNKFAFKSLNN